MSQKEVWTRLKIGDKGCEINKKKPGIAENNT